MQTVTPWVHDSKASVHNISSSLWSPQKRGRGTLTYDKGTICNPQTEEPLPSGIQTWSLEFTRRTLIKIQNTRQLFARACVEKLEERVRLSDPRQRIELRSSFHYHLCEWKTKYPRKRQRWRETGARADAASCCSAHPHIRRCCWGLRARACIAEWAFEVPAGKEDPVWRGDITDLLVEQSQEI